MTIYEWVLELTDNRSGDIIEVYHADSLAEFKKEDWNTQLGTHYALALTQLIGDEMEGLQDCGYAYCENGELYPEFDNNKSVPKRFIQEVEKNKDWVRQFL